MIPFRPVHRPKTRANDAPTNPAWQVSEEIARAERALAEKNNDTTHEGLPVVNELAAAERKRLHKLRKRKRAGRR